MSAPKEEIILYHYYFSPYARRIVWYLNLRGIPYTQCLQPPIMPRPDTASIGTSYRRIPILSIGRDIYNDTRLILHKLETLYPTTPSNPSLSALTPSDKALEKLLEKWAVDGGLFARAAQLIPAGLPLMKDEGFKRDRAEFSGRSWSKEAVERARPEALMEYVEAFEVLEEWVLGDGREWVLGNEGPKLADIEAIWTFHWLSTLPGALPAELFSPAKYPKVFAWIKRFDKAVKAAATKAGKPKTVKGPEALRIVSSSGFAEAEGSVDARDPTGLKKGQEIEVWPIESGFTRKDKGPLVALSSSEIVIESRTEDGKMVRVHAPRHGFRVKSSSGEGRL